MEKLKKLLKKYVPFWHSVLRRNKLKRLANLPDGYYSQFGEDRELEKFWHLAEPGKDIFVDVGAWHPVQFSNTFRLYKRGMRGVVVEPSTTFIEEFKWLRPEDTLITSCAGSTFGILPFAEFEGGLLNTLDPEALADYLEKGNKVSRRSMMPVIPVNEVLKKMSFDRIFLLDIDAEGHDFQVLQGCSDFLDRVMILAIETEIHPDKRSEIDDYLIERGFNKAKTIKATSLWVNPKHVPDAG